MEPNKKKPNKRKKAGTLRGDVLRRASEKEVRGRGHARKSFSDFFIQFDEEDKLEDTRDWLSNRDDIYLVYSQLVGAGYDVEKLLTEHELRAHFLVAEKEGKKRVVVPVSTGCFNFTPARIHLLVEKNPAAAALHGDDTTTNMNTNTNTSTATDQPNQLTLAFVDSDSVSLLPVSNLLQHPFT